MARGERQAAEEDLAASLADASPGELPAALGLSFGAANGSPSAPDEDLPAPLAGGGRGGGARSPARAAWAGDDLPAVSAQEAPGALPAVVSPAADREAPLDDLPVVAPPAAREARPLEGGLPTVSASGAPSPVGFGDLPAILGGGASDEPRGLADGSAQKADLPVVPGGHGTAPAGFASSDFGEDLPAVSSGGGAATGAAASGTPAEARSAAPAVGEGDDLPSVLGGGDPDLPSVLSGLGPSALDDLPDVSSAGLPAPAQNLPAAQQAGLPANPQVELPTARDVELPIVSAAGLPQAAGFGRVDLPDNAGALPEVQSTLPELQSSLPELQSSLPTGAAASLPLVSDAFPALHDGDPRASDPFELEADPFGTVDDAAERGSGFSFPPEGEPFASVPPGDPDDPFSQTLEAGEAVGTEASFPTESDAPAAGGAYGEVSLAGEAGSGGLETAEDMEFGEIPQERPGRAGAEGVDLGADPAATGATLELQRGGGKTPRAAHVTRIAVAAVIGLGVIGGSSLALVPDVGPFAIHSIMDRVNRAEHERMLSSLRRHSEERLAQDTLEQARQAIEEAERSTREAPRFQPLKAHAATVLHAAALRFGPLPEIEAAGKSLVQALDPERDDASFQLARASELAASEGGSKAIAALSAVAAQPQAEALLGEVLLRAGEGARALATWSKLAKSEDGARSRFGLARASLLVGDSAGALVQVERVLKANPEHLGAHIVRLDAERLARESGEGGGKVDLEALAERVEEILASAAPAEKAAAFEVLGDLHLAYGRNSMANKAFEEALAIDRQAPRALVGLGETLYGEGRHAEALARFEAARSSRPLSLRAALGIAKCQVALEHVPEASKLLAELARKHPENVEVRYLQAAADEAAEHYDEAMAGYAAAIELAGGKPESIKSYLALSALQTDQGLVERAKETLAEAAAKLPPSSALSVALGQLSMKESSYRTAREHFARALELDPANTRARFLGAVTLTRLGHFDAALEAFDSVKKADSEYPGLSMERGRLYEVSGRVAEALEQYEAAFEAAPDDEELQLRVGCARVLAGHAAAATELLEKLTRTQARSAEANYCLGRALSRTGSKLDAVRYLERAVALDPEQAVYYLYLGWASSEMGRQGDAAKALDKALELDAGLADAYWLRGNLRRKQGAVRDAVADLRKALTLAPDRVEAHADLAFALSELGRRAEAMSEWKRAVAARPDEAAWRFRYGKLLSSQGRRSAAATELTKAISLAEDQAESLDAPWLWQAHYLVARAISPSERAISHWQSFMRMSPIDNPYRKEAKRALDKLGSPWSN